MFAVGPVAETPHLTFAGLHAYHGSAQHLRQWEERRQAIAQATDTAGRIRDLLARHGIECPTVTGAGTFEFEAASGVCTVLQCGSYVFIDADYGRNLDRDGAPTKAFEPSLFVWVTVMSRRPEGAREPAPAAGPLQKDIRIDQNSQAAYSKYFWISGGSGASKSLAM